MRLQQKISSPIAFIIIIIFGLIVTSVTVKVGSGIINDFSDSEVIKSYEKEINDAIVK